MAFQAPDGIPSAAWPSAHTAAWCPSARLCPPAAGASPTSSSSPTTASARLGSHGQSHVPEAPDVFRALKQPGLETPKHRFLGCLMEGSGLPLKAPEPSQVEKSQPYPKTVVPNARRPRGRHLRKPHERQTAPSPLTPTRRTLRQLQGIECHWCRPFLARARE